jgi:steroid delta-isomerase-like uncharacterized protein
MERSEIEGLVARWLDIVESGNVALFDEILSENVVDHSGATPELGPETFKRRALALRGAFWNLEATLDELIVERTRIAWRWRVEGTHGGSFGGVAATGKRVTMRGVNFQRLEQGRVVEHFTLADTAGLLALLRPA